jgi:hypothetical protein
MHDHEMNQGYCDSNVQVITLKIILPLLSTKRHKVQVTVLIL